MLITVFTPTYNRAYTLQRVFDSLMAQTFAHNQFEWILIDDGSSDNTQELVKEFLQKTDFKIEYFFQENSGKNYCHNKAITLAKGELFLILDSDDAIVPEAMEIFWNYWSKIDKQLHNNIYGISCLCKNGYNNQLIGHTLREGLIENAFEWKHKNKIYFEGWSALNTSLFKKHLFPEIEGIKFIPEAYLWDKMGKNRKLVVTNEILRIVYHQDDGFSNDIVRSYKNHSRGRYIYHQMVINELFLDLIKINPVRLLKDFIQFGRMGFHSRYTVRQMVNHIDTSYKKLIFLIALPISFYFYTKDISIN